jgi:hypothetical protein
MCFEDWKCYEKPIYEPLLWSLKAVNVCGIHSIVLQEQCPLCSMKIPVLSRKSRNGFCSFCGYWLGSYNVDLNKEIIKEQSSEDYFVESNIKDLIRICNEIPMCLSYETVLRFFIQVIDNTGGVGVFASSFDFSRTTAGEWYYGRHKLPLNAFL